MSETPKRRWRGSTGLFPQPVGTVLNTVTAPIVRKHGSVKARIFAQWPQIVGEDLAAKCQPKTLTFSPQSKNSGKLTLTVRNGFALEIQHSVPLILERLANFLGSRCIESIRIVQT
jgi:hypothetical protein